MAKAPRRGLPGRGVLAACLFTVCASIAALVYLGLESFQREKQALAIVTAANTRLVEDRLREEVERRLTHLAGACLRDSALSQLRPWLEQPDTPASRRKLRALLDTVRERHPVALHFFLVEDDEVRFPAVRSSLRRKPGVAAGNGAFAKLFAGAENQELGLRRPDLALDAYKRCSELRVPAGLKALAVARIARCLRKLNREDDAQKTYRTLLEKYGDEYGPFGRPYALVAGFELAGADLPRLYSDLINGRWELTADQLEYFLARFRERLPGSLNHSARTRYLDHLEFARTLEAGFRHQGPLRDDTIYRYDVSSASAPYRTFYTGLGPNRLLGVAVDPDWVETRLLPQCRTGLALGEGQATPAETAGWGEAVFGLALGLALVGMVLGLVILVRDVRHQQQINKLRADFVNGVSHELKNPLQWIRSCAETLLRGRDSPDREAYHRLIIFESDRLARSIDKVLNFARIDRGHPRYEFEEADLASLVAGLVQGYTQHLVEQGFEVQSNIAAEPAPVLLDADAVSQAVLNLLDNAAKYSGESRFVAVRLWSANGEAVFEVEDRGVGIPPEERETIFEPFHRVQNNLGKGGTGLGLFLVKHAMEAHGGRVEVESEPGQGSRFRLVFPRYAEDPGG